MAKILVVDDDELMLNVITLILLSEKHDVMACSDGVEALELLKKENSGTAPFKLLITDIHMDSMNGIDLIENVSNLKIPPKTLAMTGDGTKEIVVDLIHLSCGDYIEKPFEDDELIAKVEKLLCQDRKIHDKQLELEMALEKKLREYEYRYEELHKRLSKAKDSYRDIVSNQFDTVPAEVKVCSQTYEELGGDFFQISKDEHTINIFIADVAGHDLGAAYHTILLKAFYEEFNEYCSDNHQLFFKNLNGALLKFKLDRMVTAQLLTIDLKNHKYRLSSAGHVPLIKSSKEHSSLDFVEVNGSVLGIVEIETLESYVGDWSNGERFYLFTDGIIELSKIDTATGIARYFSKEKLLEHLTVKQKNSLSDQVEEVFNEVIEWGEYKIQDDLLLIGIEPKGE